MENLVPFLRILLQVLQLVVAVFLVLLVLIHSPKGDGLGGFGGTSQIFSSQKGAEAALNKTTAWAAGIFYVVSFALANYLGY
jgi:preprotein translocase subunit SecG